jgi:hypothetical protein
VRSLPRRLWGAARLDAETYEEVEADPRSLGQAALVVGAVALASGAVRGFQIADAALPPDRVALQVVLAVIEPVVLWVGGSALALMVGATFFRGPETESDFPEVLRTMGFAFAPGLLGILAVLPPPTLGLAIGLASRLWVLLAVVIALRQALDFTTARAVATFGTAAVLLYLMLWGLTVAPLVPL